MIDNGQSFLYILVNKRGITMNIIQTLAKSHKWNLPTVCPVCGGELTLSDNHCQLKCSNDFCKSKTSGRINKWTNTLDIKEFGLNTIETLIDNGVIDSISSLYKMNLNKIASIEGMGMRSAEKMKKELDAHKEMSLAKFIAGYNIEGVGEKVIENIISSYGFKTLEDLINAKSFVCDGVGDVISNKLVAGLKALKSDMKKTIEFVTIKNVAKKKTAGGSLNGKSFCFTGAASRPRKELWELVEKNGGIVHESMKKDTQFLVLADPNSTSSKAQKARKQGTNLLSEDDFVKMCGN